MVAVAFLSKAELHFSWSDNASWCCQLPASVCLSWGLLLCIRIWWLQGWCPDLHSLPTQCLKQSNGDPVLISVGACPSGRFPPVQTWKKKGKLCSQIRCCVLGCTKLWYLDNDQSLCESNGLWGEPAAWIAQRKFTSLLGTAAVFKGYFMPLFLWPLPANATSLVWWFSYFPFTSSVLPHFLKCSNSKFTADSSAHSSRLQTHPWYERNVII